MSKKTLFDDDSDEEIAIKTENEYAKKYDKWREKEEIHKLEQKYGSNVLDSNASGSSDSDDDEPPEINEEMEAQFLKTLSLLKTKDPRIYDPNFQFFEEEKVKEPGTNNDKKMLTFEDSDDNDDENEGGAIFKIEKKAEIETTQTTNDEMKTTKPEKKIKEYLIGEAEHIDEEVEKDLAPLKALWSDPKLNEGEAFLRDYILNKRYLDEGAQVTADEELEADEQTVEEQAKFERAYNFRFEEPDDEYLKRFPRTMNSIRPKDDRRSRKRAEVRARKEQEKRRKMDEIARLKALKLNEIREKIAKIKEVTGNDDLAFKEEDIEGDFDPEEHDRRMRALFDEQYYGHADDHKPTFPELDQELEIENWAAYDAEQERAADADEELHCEDQDFNMDAEYEPKQQPRESLQQLLQQGLARGRGRRRRRQRDSQLALLLKTDKPRFDPVARRESYAQYMEQYYALECEDVVGGDLPTRFKYRSVPPNGYGLSVEEILLADDKELTQWVPLKRVVKYRGDAEEQATAAAFRQRAADARLKRKLLPSLFRDLPQEPEVISVEENTATKKKKKKDTDKLDSNTNAGDSESNIVNHVDNGDADGELQDIALKEKKKKRKKNKNIVTQEDVPMTTNNENGDVVQKESQKAMKKKKHKSNGFVVTDVCSVQPSQETNNNTAEHSHNDHSKEQEKSSKKNLKRKMDPDTNTEQRKKKKHKNNFIQNVTNNNSKNVKTKTKTKNKHKIDKSNENPLAKLSDERLKAYGLNPKKYRGFLKYKKF